MLNIPNYCRRNANLKTRNQFPPVRMVIVTSLKTINRGESQAERKPPNMVSVNGHWKQPLEMTVSSGQKLKLQKSSAHGPTYPHLGLYPEETISEKDTGTP